MRKNYLLLATMFISLAGTAQLNIQSGATFFIQTGATVTVQGDVTSNSNIQGTGLLQLKGTSAQNFNMNGNSVANLEVDNASNITFGGGAVVTNSLLFTNGKLQLGNNNLTLESAATITGADATKYVVTNGTGQLVKNSLSTTPFTYPVGYDATTYNPLSVTQNGTTDNIGVRVLQNVQQAGTSGAALVKEVVDASWVLSEGTAGGSSLSVTATWNGTDELTGFSRTKTGLSVYDGTSWDLTYAQTASATGAGPYTVTRSNITNIGALAVGNRPVYIPLLVSPKVFLQGPTFASGLMADGLRAAGVIPTTEPYTGLSNYTHSGSGGAETIPSSILVAQAPVNNSIVDWVFLQLHDGTTGTVLATRAALIERDGDIVDVDGTNTKTNFVNFAGFTGGNYYVSVRHRNHLGARTAATLALSRTSTTTYDFTTATTQAFPGSVSNAPLATITTGVFGLWGGDANGNGVTRKTGGSTVNDFSVFSTYLGASSIISNVYRREDFNMDGTVRKTGGSTVNDFSKFAAILGATSIITQPAF